MAELWQLLFDPQPGQFAVAMAAWLGLAVLGGAAAAAAASVGRRLGLELWPPQRRRAVPWGGVGVAAAVCFVYLAPVFPQALLLNSGFLERQYGPNFFSDLRDARGLAHEIAVSRLNLWAFVLAFPYVLAFLIGPFPLFFGAAGYHVGWTSHRAKQNALLGGLTWLAVTPLLYAFYVAVTLAYQYWLRGPPQPHALEVLARGAPSALDWTLLVFSAAVAAPVQEELLFRGVMLPWADLTPRNADWLVAWSLPLSLVLRAEGIQEAVRDGAAERLALELQPAAYTLVMTAAYVVLRLTWHAPVAAGIFATALLFACAHVQAWPSPLPLFFLGAVLAWLAYRTQSLVAPITVHALFNAVACVELLAN